MNVVVFLPESDRRLLREFEGSHRVTRVAEPQQLASVARRQRPDWVVADLDLMSNEDAQALVTCLRGGRTDHPRLLFITAYPPGRSFSFALDGEHEFFVERPAAQRLAMRAVQALAA